MVEWNWSQMTFGQWAGLTTGQWSDCWGVSGRSPNASAVTGDLPAVRLRLEKLRSGDATEWRQLIESYYDQAVDRIFAMVRDHHDACDVGQDVFVRLWERRSDLGHVDNLGSYIMAAARNHALNFRRKRHNSKKSVMLLGEMGHLPCSKRCDRASELRTRQRLEILQGIPELLTFAQGRVFAEIRTEPSASIRVIGNRLDCSHANIQAILKRIRRISRIAVQASQRESSNE